MNDQQICLRTVDDLRVEPGSNIPLQFTIPAYQRGYRWRSLQVTQLLDDIREFIKRRNPQPEDFYCLQPLVIKIRSGGVFEVVDGQQRLTTLLLILRHFNQRLTEKYRQKLFTLTYETRPSLDDFLDSPSKEAADENVDFFYLYQAFQAIEKWFDARESEVEAIKSALLTQTKVIWFELAERDNPVDAFTRLNVGKIPLTNDELIRALFLRRTNPDDKDAINIQMQIAYEWDQLEKGLQSDDFWYFLSNQSRTGQNRIDFIFDLVARVEGMSAEMANDAYGLFYTFNQRLKEEGATPKSEWLKIKQTFMILEEWFEDRTLYHMVGYLISQYTPIDTILKLSQDSTKSEFVRNLRNTIYNHIITSEHEGLPSNQDIRIEVGDHLETLIYGSKNQQIAATLLLFNLATLLQNRRSNIRFQFDSFKTERWDIEHIRSIADEKPVRPHHRRDWLTNCLGYLRLQDSDTELCSRIEEFLKPPQVDDMEKRFDILYEEILNIFGEATEGDAVQGLSNLTLLDNETNRSYKNAVFAVKRHRILNLDQHGIFVPLCTRNVFLKCYSPQVGNALFWGEEDQRGYQEVIASVLVDFFCG